MSENLAFSTNEVCVSLDRETGRILSVLRNGTPVASESKSAFLLQLLDRNGDKHPLKSGNFSSCVFQDNVFEYTGCSAFPNLSVRVSIRKTGRYIAFRYAVAGIPEDHVLEWVDGPAVTIRPEQTLFMPLHDGVMIENHAHSPRGYHPIEFARRGVAFGGLFPGRCMMQYTAAFAGNKGLFFAAFDKKAVPKAVEFDPGDGSGTRLSLQTFTGCGFGSGYLTPFEYVITGFDGDWMTAASLYRDWYDTFAPAKRPYPSWMEKSPVTVIYPVLGEGLDHGKHKLHPNCYYPYGNALPCMDGFNKKFDSAVLALLMHWEGTAPWAPPYVWPPLGGEELLSTLRDGLHAKGNLLGLYCSGTAWTQTSSINDYSQEERCRKEGLERYMLRGPKGEIEATVCNGLDSQRLGYDMCLCEEWSRRQVVDEIRKMARFGTDYCQYFDQNHGGGQLVCYSKEHTHSPVPGPAQTDSSLALMEEISDAVREENSEMVLGCESSAAEPFADYLKLNDARSTFLWWFGVPVPAQSFIFHGRTMCFSGNQGGTVWMFRYKENPENLLYRIAYGFNAGDLLAVTLKENGHIHWGWGVPWTEPEPEQEQVCTLVRNLNAVRKKYPEFLLHGRMLEPLHSVKAGTWTLKLEKRDELCSSVLHNSWQSPDGKKAQIITNYLPQDQTVAVDGKQVLIPALSAKVIQEECFSGIKTCLSTAYSAEDVKLLIPEIIYAVPGVEMNVYFRNVVTVINPANYVFEVECCKGRNELKRWSFIPDAADAGTWTWKIRVTGQTGTVAEAESKLVVVPADSGAGESFSMLMVGASQTKAGHYANRVLSLMQRPGNPEFTMIGTRRTYAEKTEGYGGWRWDTFMTKWGITQPNTKDGMHPDRAVDYNSPFLFPDPADNSKPVFDLNEYFRRENDGKVPDAVSFQLGLNDFALAADDTVEKITMGSLANMEKLISEFRKLVPQPLIFVFQHIPGSDQNGFAQSYGCTLKSWQYRKNLDFYNRALLKKCREMNLIVVPMYINIDTEHNYPMQEQPVNKDNPQTVFRASNGVHPAQAGYYQMGDTLYSWLKGILWTRTRQNSAK